MKIFLLFVIFLFAIIENWYFGWNLYPHSLAEFVCNVLVIVLANIVLLFKRRS